MTIPAVTVSASDPPLAAMAVLEAQAVSAAPVVDSEGRLVGVVSTTDLVRDAGSGGNAASVQALMSSPPIIASPYETIEQAARHLVTARVHRLIVVANGRAVGILSAFDILGEVRDCGLATPLRAIMTSPVETISTDTSVEVATALLTSTAVHALVVVDGASPVGVFTHADALASRNLSRRARQTPVEKVVSFDVICLDSRTEAGLAAAKVRSRNVSRILVMEGERVIGIVTTIDLVRELVRTTVTTTAAPSHGVRPSPVPVLTTADARKQSTQTSVERWPHVTRGGAPARQPRARLETAVRRGR